VCGDWGYERGFRSKSQKGKLESARFKESEITPQGGRGGKTLKLAIDDNRVKGGKNPTKHNQKITVDHM